jgi:hypothetical protein
MFFLRGFKFVELFRVRHTHNGLVLNNVMKTNNIDIPSSLKGEIQLATSITIVAGTTTTILVIAIVATSTIFIAKTNSCYFTSPIWSLCKFPYVFVQIIFDFN